MYLFPEETGWEEGMCKHIELLCVDPAPGLSRHWEGSANSSVTLQVSRRCPERYSHLLNVTQ